MSRSGKILFVVFLYFYLPLTYYWGWVLTKVVAFDFPSFYHAARIVFVQGDSPYGDAFREVSFAMGRKVHPYLYPPPSLIAFWPLAHFSILQAQTGFLIASHLCLLGSLWLICTKLTPLPAESRLRDLTIGISVIYILSFDPAQRTLALGQVNLIALFFICLALIGIKENTSAWRVALPLSVAILLKTYPVLLLIPLLFRRKFRAAGLTVAFLGVFTAIAAVTVPDLAWSDWLYLVVPQGGYANNAISAGFIWNQSLNAFVTRLLVPSEFSEAPFALAWLAKPLAAGLALLVAAATLFFSSRLNRQMRAGIAGDLEIAAYLLMIFLVAPLSWDHHLVYVLPAVILAISLLVGGSIRSIGAVAVVASIFLLAWSLPIDQPGWRHGWWTLLISTKLYCVIALWLFILNRMRTEAAAATSPEKFSTSLYPASDAACVKGWDSLNRRIGLFAA
jgi:alpha-1,2-mannosyltransferase